MSIHPIQGFKSLPKAKKAAIIGTTAAVAVTALNIAAAAHGKQVLTDKFTQEGAEEVQKFGMFQKLGAGFGDWKDSAVKFVGGLFNKKGAQVQPEEKITDTVEEAVQGAADAATEAGAKIEGLEDSGIV